MAAVGEQVEEEEAPGGTLDTFVEPTESALAEEHMETEPAREEVLGEQMETEPAHGETLGGLPETDLGEMISVSGYDHNLIEDMLSEQAQRESTVDTDRSEGLLVATQELPSSSSEIPPSSTHVEPAIVPAPAEDSPVQLGPTPAQGGVESSSVSVHEVERPLIEQTTQVEGSIVQPGPPPVQESALVVPEVGTASARQAAGSSSQTAPSSSLYDTIKRLMSDEDPEKALVNAELEGFIVLLNNAIEKVTNKDSSFGGFKRLLDRRVASIRAEGYTDLADSIAEDLVQLEQELAAFLRLRSEGASTYISSRIESVMQAREAKRRDVEQELHQVQAQSNRIRPVLNAKEKEKADLTHSVKQQALRVAQLREALKDAEEAQSLLEADLLGAEKSCSKLTEQMKTFDERAVELDRKIVQLLTLNEASKALLEEELKQQYEDELSNLRDRIRHRQLSA